MSTNGQVAPVALKAVTYIRVSTTEQKEDGFSLQAQHQILEGYAARCGFDIVKEFEDSETAKGTGRTAFNEMLQFLKASKSELKPVILVEKTDRLYRNIKDYVTVDDLKLAVHFVKENEIVDPNSHSSTKFTHGIKVMMAKYHSDNLGEEVTKGMEQKTREGYWPSKAPVGYKNVHHPGRKVIEPDPRYAPMVKSIFALYSTGEYSLQDITDKIAEEGYKSPNTGKPFPMASVHRILQVLTYTGRMRWNGVVSNGTHEPLVTFETFERCREVRTGRSDGRRRKRKHDFAYSGIVKCGYSNGYLVADQHDNYRYIYYSPSKYTGPGKKPNVREEVLDAAFAKVLDELCFDEEILEWLVTALKESHKDKDKYVKEQMSRLQAEYKKLENRLDAIYLDKLDGEVETDDYERMTKQWRSDREKLKTQMEKLEQMNDDHIDDGVALLNLAKNASNLFKKQSPEQKRRMLKLLGSNSVWKDKALTVVLAEPFEMLRVTNVTWQKEKSSKPSSEDFHHCWYTREELNL